MNHKRVYRLYCAEGLQVRRRKRKKVAGLQRGRPAAPVRRDQQWSLDFVLDSVTDGRRL